MRREYVYVIVRWGSNAANQHLCNRAVVGTVAAATQSEAVEIAPDALGITVYSNRHLEPRLYSRAGRVDQQAADEADSEAIEIRRELAEWEAEAARAPRAH